MTSLMRASGRSILLITRITGRRASSALRSTKRVCGSGPSLASTSSRIPSTIVSPRSTSPPKSAWPGVSTMLSFTPLCRTAVFLARIVMPFSRSRSIESMTRSFTSWFWRKAPDCQSIASTSVVLPWSTWATIATLRRSSRTAMRQLKLAAAFGRTPRIGGCLACYACPFEVAFALAPLRQAVLPAGFVLTGSGPLLTIARVQLLRLRVLLAEQRHEVSLLSRGKRLNSFRGGSRLRELVRLAGPEVDQIGVPGLPRGSADRRCRVVDLWVRGRCVRVLIHEAVADAARELRGEGTCERGRCGGGDRVALGLRRTGLGREHESGADGCGG